MQRRILVLSAGSVASNNLIRSLKCADRSSFTVACAEDPFALRRSLADRNYHIASSGRQALAAIRRIVKAEGIGLLVANSDADISLVSRQRDSLGCRVFLPKQAIIDRCADKFELTAFLRRRGMRAPATAAVEDIDHLDELFRKLPGRPLWCRIRKGSGSIGAIPVKSADQARFWITYWEEMRGIPRGMFTLAEYLPGRDITVQCVFRNGRLFISKMLHRISYNVIGGGPSGISSTASLGRMIHEPRIASLCVKAVTALDPKASGAFAVDLREDAEGRPCITEVNAGRFANGPVVHDLDGHPSTVLTYVRLGLGERVEVVRARRYDDDPYIMRHLDIAPTVVRESELWEGVLRAGR